jgi:hypothetical protein
MSALSRDFGDDPIFLSLHNLWPKRWVGYDRVGAGLFGFPASNLGFPDL